MPPKRAATHSNYVPPQYDLSDDDELDELVDEEEFKPTPNGANALRGSLTKPRFSIMTCKQIHDLRHQELIDLEAEYQRDVVWNTTKQSALIQSLFMNYYIPPVIFDTRIDPETGEEKRTCIDGKQRITSIVSFMDGQIPFITQHTKEKFYYKLGQNRGRQLPDHLRRRFDTLDVQSVEYDRLADKEQRDIFQRVQMGVALSAPEKLQAIPGPWPKWIVELQKKYITEEGGLRDTMQWDVSRGRAFQALTAFMMMAVDPTRRSAPTYGSMTTFLERSDEPDPAFEDKIQTALSILVRIASELFDEAFAKPPQRVAPVELWFTCLLVFTRMSYYSLDRLATSISQMRQYVRQRHVDIRANGKVIGDLHTFLGGLDRKRAEVPAAADFDMAEDDPRVARANKRNRRAEEQDPSYEGPVVPRFERSDVVGNTRGQQAAAATAANTRPANSPAQAATNMSYQPRGPPGPPPPATYSPSTNGTRHMQSQPLFLANSGNPSAGPTYNAARVQQMNTANVASGSRWQTS